VYLRDEVSWGLTPNEKNMKINFLIPTTGLTGGIKVIFKHANNLTDMGHQVNIIYPFVLNQNAQYKEKMLGYLKKIRRFFLRVIGKDKIEWFHLKSQIKVLRVFDLNSKNIPNADITVATANETADWLQNYPPTKGKKFYFIQDYEVWSRDREMVDATWKMPIKKIVIANWLRDLGEKKFQEKIYGYVPNGVDLKKFYNHQKVFGQPQQILMMYHILPKKGTVDGLRALSFVREKYPKTKLTLFGYYRPRISLPKKTSFFYRPNPSTLRKLYSLADIFLWPSQVEGFGLPPMEAMACKCAVICTDTGAIRDYAIPNRTVIIVPPQRPDLIAQKIIDLIENREKTKKISLSGAKKMKEFTWEKSSQKLEKIFLDNL